MSNYPRAYRPVASLRSANWRMSRVRSMFAAMLPLDCWRCGYPITVADDWDVGHRVARVLGGSDDISNLWPEHRNRTAHCFGNQPSGRALSGMGVGKRVRPTSREW